MSEQQFKGQKLLVIGGTSGIGLETAKKVAEQGGTVVIVGNRADKAETARKQLVAITSEEQVFALTADLTNFDSVQKLISKLDSEHKDINLLVNSAGIYPKSFLEHSLSDYNNFLDLNRAFFFITQQVASSMVAQNKEGSIVNVSAVAARQAIETVTASAYSMAKMGLEAMTRHVAAELAEHGIRVNAVSPGMVETRIFERFIPSDQLDNALQDFNSFHPLGRNGTPNDVAETIVFLLSENILGNWCYLGC